MRRDLIALEREGVVKRVHGGALAAAAREPQGYDFARQSSGWRRPRHGSRAAAAALVEDGQLVILDGGSTVAAVARELVARSLHVLTNSLPIAELVKDARQIELTLTGGGCTRASVCMLGPLTEQMLAAVVRRHAGHGHRRRHGDGLRQQQHAGGRLRAQDDRGLAPRRDRR